MTKEIQKVPQKKQLAMAVEQGTLQNAVDANEDLLWEDLIDVKESAAKALVLQGRSLELSLSERLMNKDFRQVYDTTDDVKNIITSSSKAIADLTKDIQWNYERHKNRKGKIMADTMDLYMDVFNRYCSIINSIETDFSNLAVAICGVYKKHGIDETPTGEKDDE